MAKIVAKTGNEVMAEAMRQINPEVVAAYPITPATEIVQIFSQFVADGEVDTEFVAVESEHSAMSATLGAAAAGVRAMTATSSQGLALMYEILPIVSALRLPIVMPEVNRALSGPINIHCDHSDTMAARDFGWIQIFTENTQEAYDSIIQAVRIAEHPLVKLPIMVTTDGFIISHCLEKIELLEDKEVQDFIGPKRVDASLLDIEHPITIGALDLQDYYFEHRRPVSDAMLRVPAVLKEVAEEFAKKFGRKYGLFEEYKLADAEAAMVCLGSTAGTTKAAVDNLRSNGLKVGLLRLRMFRPFPAEEIIKVLKHLKVIGVLDRSDMQSSTGGPVFSELRSALYDQSAKPLMIDYIYGLGGRDIKVFEIEEIFKKLLDIQKTGKVDKLVNYFGVRGE